MNFGLTEDQDSILGGLERLLASHCPALPTTAACSHYATELDGLIADAGFYGIGREAGFGSLEAALCVERLAHLPFAIEAGGSALVAPALGLPVELRPVALVDEDPMKAARFLPMARVLIVACDDHVLLLYPEPGDVEPVKTLLAYPYGRLRSIERMRQQTLPDVRTLRRRRRIALAAEAAGCMAAALDQVLEHVKIRRAFGRPLGALQVIQHRLAMAAESTESAKWLAFRAAWSDSEGDAAIAAGFAQSRIAQLTYDLHQFSGAMGLTLEFPLHLWTYRLRALAGELGGSSAQSRACALTTWPSSS